jgi:tetratricopeptide (TPR) repeat protein
VDRDSVVYFCRPEADCTLAVAQDQLKTDLKNFAVLDDAALLFMARGEYAQAITLLRRAVDVPPANGYSHSQLGLALALAGNFADARREFTAAASSPERPRATCAEIIWTHFIEGSFSEAAQAADGCRAGKEHHSAEPVLLKYFSLVRLGRQAEAEKYLSSETQDFVGEDTEHLLLLEFQGRLQDRLSGFDAPWIRRRFAFFNGLQREARGHSADAVSIFQGPIFSRKDSLIALAARTEVLRLKSAPPAN